MDTFQLFSADAFQQNETQLFLNIDAKAEQTFLSQVGGAAARKRDVAAMADQYSGTLVGTLCFAGSDPAALAIWVQRAHELEMMTLLTVNAEDSSLQQKITDFCTDGIVLDCRNIDDFSIINAVSEAVADGLLYVLLRADLKTLTDQGINFAHVHGVIVCGKDDCTDVDLPVTQWLNTLQDTEVVAGVSSMLCEANGKKWFATPEIMNGQAVTYLSQGCAGLWLDGFCADLFDPDSMLFDIYETCGQLNACVGAKRRHLHLVNALRTVLPGADYRCTLPVSPVLDGAPVCVVIAVDDAADENAISVFYGEKKLEYTGEPVVIIRNEKGRLCENRCLGAQTRCFEFYAGNHVGNDKFAIRIHNNTKKNVILRWVEASVNI